MVGLPLKKDNIYAAMPEFFSTMFAGAKYCPVAKTATIDGAVFDLKNKVCERGGSLGTRINPSVLLN